MLSAAASAIAGPALSAWTVGLIIFVLWLMVWFVVRRLGMTAILRAAKATQWQWIDVLINALLPALAIAIVISGLAIIAQVWPIPPRLRSVVSITVTGGIALALVLFAARITRLSMERVALRLPVMQAGYAPVTAVLRGLIIGLGLLMFLQSIGISISPILASLGIGSLAVALALQDTLKNLFAGFYITLDKPLEHGDFVKLESGQEGQLTKLGWRSSNFRMLNGGLVAIPNSKLADSVLTNYRAADGEVALSVDLAVAASNDLDQVEQVTLGVAREVISEVQSGTSSFQPSVRFFGFASGAVSFTVSLRAASADSIARVRHEFIKRVTTRYAREGIKTP